MVRGQAGVRPRHIGAGGVPGQAVARPSPIRVGSRAGQASVELIAILGVSLVVILMFMALSLNFLSSTNLQKDEETARDTVQKLAQAADFVYAQGEGASEVVAIMLPGTASFDPNQTYVGKPQSAGFAVPSTQIKVNVLGTDVYATTSEPVHGSFPSSPGVHSMRVYSAGSYVVISPNIASLDRQSVFVSMASGETRSETLTLRSLVTEPVSAGIYQSWNYSDVSVSFPASPFNVQVGGTKVSLGISAGAAADGLYSSQLVILAQELASGDNETFIVPITVNVHAVSP